MLYLPWEVVTRIDGQVEIRDSDQGIIATMKQGPDEARRNADMIVASVHAAMLQPK